MDYEKISDYLYATFVIFAILPFVIVRAVKFVRNELR